MWTRVAQPAVLEHAAAAGSMPGAVIQPCGAEQLARWQQGSAGSCNDRVGEFTWEKLEA